jgi:hypothetical protein
MWQRFTSQSPIICLPEGTCAYFKSLSGNVRVKWYDKQTSTEIMQTATLESGYINTSFPVSIEFVNQENCIYEIYEMNNVIDDYK